ncbi:hypothetical protein ACVXG7_09035 [Enterobacter hormaechei]
MPIVEGSSTRSTPRILLEACRPICLTRIPSGAEDRLLESLFCSISARRHCSVQATAKPLVHGTLSRQSFSSHILGSARDVMIYQPRGAQPARWTLILFDGEVYQDEYHFAKRAGWSDRPASPAAD